MRVHIEGGPRLAAVMRIVWIAIGLGVLAFALRTLIAPGESGLGAALDDYLSIGLLLACAGAVAARAALVPGDRVAWALIAAAILAWAAGDAYYSSRLASLEEPPFPSWADAGYLGVYPPAYAGLVLLMRRRLRRFHASQWLDGLAAALCVAAAGAAFVLPPVAGAAEGTATAVATNLAYPLADLVLIGVVVALTALTGLRPGVQWGVLGLGLGIFALADCLYLYRIATDSYVMGTPLDALWVVGLTLMGASAWLRPPDEPRVRVEGWRLLAVPAAVATLALGLLLAEAHMDGSTAAAWCAAGAVAVALARAGLTFRENVALADSHRLAVTDALTGLPNRRLFLDRAEQALLRARRAGGAAAVIIIDLDDFKEVNDTLGHHAGDELLVCVARRLRRALRESDTVARLGGDEFAVVLPDVTDAGAAARVAAELRTAIARPAVVAGLSLDTEASMGIAVFPAHGADVAQLLQRADVAMYQAKSHGTGHEVYRAEDDVHSPERLALVGELRRAIDEGEIEVHYQPKVDLASGVTGGVEALVRWRHPARGLLPPVEFIPVAERTTLIAPLTRHVMDRALAQARAWDDAGLPLAVAVNVSVRNLLDARFPEQVAELLARHGVPARRLELEITESVLMANPARALEILGRLHEMGVVLSIDDFGVGYSSLDYLKRLPVDVIKIDRSFVMHMATDPADAMIVRSTIDLARNLGLRVVAEGIEDAQALETLRALGCHLGQGYHLGRPVPAEALRLPAVEPAVTAG